LVDNVEVGSVSPGAVEVLEVPAGPHQLQLKIDWCTSETLGFDLAPNGEAHFDCAPGGSAFTAARDTTKGSGGYIDLAPNPDARNRVADSGRRVVSARTGVLLGAAIGNVVLAGLLLLLVPAAMPAAARLMALVVGLGYIDYLAVYYDAVTMKDRSRTPIGYGLIMRLAGG
jgi:hypothetical protein